MPNVVKRLRNKIWGILVASFYALVLTILIILYLLSGQRAQEAAYQALYSSLFSDELYFSDMFFSVEMEANYEILYIHSYFDIPEEEYENLVAIVLENARDHNVITSNGQTWTYAFVPMGEVPYDYYGINQPEEVIGYRGLRQRLILVDVSDVFLRHNNLLRVLVAIGASSFLVILAGSYVAAKYFVKSTKRSFEAHEKMTAQQKKFTANATHELKTPIAMIKGSYDEILRNKDQTIESQIKWFNMIEFGTKRMESLTNELLTLARLEGQTIEFPKTELNISDIMNRTVETMQVLANEKDIQITKDIAPNLIATLNEEKFVQVGMIFLENAIKYVDDAGRIEISAYENNGRIMISIQNSGPGIPPEALPRLFDRFYRVNEKNKSGVGLGLPIAKEITEQLGGEIAIDSVVNEVTTVLLKF